MPYNYVTNTLIGEVSRGTCCMNICSLYALEVRDSVYLIIIIIRPHIAIDELMGRKAIFNQPTFMHSPSTTSFISALMLHYLSFLHLPSTLSQFCTHFPSYPLFVFTLPHVPFLHSPFAIFHCCPHIPPSLMCTLAIHPHNANSLSSF